MKGIKLNIVLLLLMLVYPTLIVSECCDESYKLYYTVVYGSKNEKECLKLARSVRLYPNKNLFRMTVCGDGKPKNGIYCGVGKCYIWGCDCDGGCIEGDEIENFYKLHPQCEFTDVRSEIR